MEAPVRIEDSENTSEDPLITELKNVFDSLLVPEGQEGQTQRLYRRLMGNRIDYELSREAAVAWLNKSHSFTRLPRDEITNAVLTLYPKGKLRQFNVSFIFGGGRSRSGDAFYILKLPEGKHATYEYIEGRKTIRILHEESPLMKKDGEAESFLELLKHHQPLPSGSNVPKPSPLPKPL